MMTTKNIFWAIIEAVIWYVFICYFLYTTQNPVDIYASGLILLVLAYAGMMACPWVRSTAAWRKMLGKE